MVVVLSVVSALVLGLVVYAFVLRPSGGTEAATGGAQPTTTVDPEAPGTTLAESDFTTFTSDQLGFSIKYPSAWTVVPTEVEGELVLDAGDGDGLFVNLLKRTDVPTTAENLVNIKAFTDGAVGLNKTAVILKVQPITLNGMPGYYYLYTFTDEESGAEGAHAHYFMFRGRNMYTMVFQAVPSDGFSRLSKVFDQIAGSFQTRPDTGPAPTPTEATTTVPG